MQLVEANQKKQPLWINNAQQGVKNVLDCYVNGDELNFKYLRLYKHRLLHLERIVLYGTGEDYSVAIAGEHCMQAITDIIVSSYPSSELAKSKTIINSDTLMLAISSTGEDKQTIYATKRAISLGARVIAVCPNYESTLSKLADKVISPNPTQKSTTFASSYLTLCLFSIYVGERLGVVAPLYQSVLLKMAELLTGKIYSASREHYSFESIANTISESEQVLACGMGVDYSLALDASRLLLSKGVNASCSYLGELPNINLENKIVLAFISSKDHLREYIDYLSQAKQNGAGVMIFTLDNLAEQINDFNGVVAFSDLVGILNPIIVSTGFRCLLN